MVAGVPSFSTEDPGPVWWRVRLTVFWKLFKPRLGAASVSSQSHTSLGGFFFFNMPEGGM